MVSRAASIILIHYYPSGNPTASAEDLEATRRVAIAGVLMNISLLDHIIISFKV
ncbi:JAB domain-containing protein [Mediterraneibacter faecis]|uniref:JAB domain-containing protein n=1 Tax=Mediterraneibacter faecis TaxID=592978 RepID=UPI0018AA9402